MGNVQAKAVIFLLIPLMFDACAHALDPSLDISQYAHTAWRVRDGFFQGPIHSIAQTRDGYLWLATEFGLLRFDGVRATSWQPPAGERLPSNVVTKLLVAGDGTLWIGTATGLASWKDGKLTQYPELAGWNVRGLIEDYEGTLWAGGYAPAAPGKLCRIKEGVAQCSDVKQGVMGLYEDSKRMLWASTFAGVWRWKPQTPEFFPIGPRTTAAMFEDNQGGLLVGSFTGIRRLLNGKTTPYRLDMMAEQPTVYCFLRDHDGGSWVGTSAGLVHLHEGRADVFRRVDGLSSDHVHALFEDREGDVWAVTEGGLDRFRNFAVPTFSSNEGFTPGTYGSILAAQDGGLWFATPDRLTSWKNWAVTSYGRPRPANNLGALTSSQEISNSGLRGHVIESIFQDSRGRLWVTVLGGFGYMENDRLVLVRAVPGEDNGSIAEGAHGNLWIDFVDHIFHLVDGKVVEQISGETLGKRGQLGGQLAVDPLQGGLWIGFWHGGVAYLRHGQIERAYTTADGLGEGRVSHLRVDREGVLWASTSGGLSRVQDGHINTLSKKNGLPCDGVHWSEEDTNHSIWLYLDCGLVRIDQSEMAAWIRDSKQATRLTLLDSYDGAAIKSGVFGAFNPPVTESQDGKLWFTVDDGVSVVDPRHPYFNGLSPPVRIEQIIADGKTYWQNWSGDASSAHPKLPPLVRDLTIDYTALSLVVPERVHFRFKLEGQDRDWRGVVNDRRVEYSNLPPRHYRFRVIACNNSGVWNEVGDTLDFSIAPAYWQTNWFRALCLAAFLALLSAAYLVRVRQLRQQERKLRDVVETIPTIAWTALPDGWVDFSNHHWEEYTGLSIEKGSGSSWEAAVHPHDVKRHTEKWHASVATGEPFESEARYRRADGEYRWFMVRAVPLWDRAGKILRWYGTKTDIEDRKRAEQLQSNITHLNRVTTLGELAASISHELKQPITAAMTNANTSLRWLRLDKPNLAEASEAIEAIVKDGVRATEIIDRLRSLYKKSPPQRESLDVNEIVQEMVILLRGEANRCAVSIRIDLAADLPKITADRVQLQQVLMNIMLNGIEAMKETGGALTVKSQPGQDGQVLISVSDTGVGLPAGNADQIFNAFFTTKPQGSGMGLAISRSVVESHGGRLWAMANDGRGATFYFTLPTAAEEMRIPAGDV